MFYPSLYPLLFFPAHGKILAWAGRKNTQAEKGNYKSICRKWECHREGHVLTFIVGKCNYSGRYAVLIL